MKLVKLNVCPMLQAFFEHHVMRKAAVFLAVSLVVTTGQVTADPGGGKNGPRASISSATTCKITEDGAFNVKITVRDESSGTVTPEVTSWEIIAFRKTATGNWKMGRQTVLGEVGVSGSALDSSSTYCRDGKFVEPFCVYEYDFSVCALVQVDPSGMLVADGKALNAQATVYYEEENIVNNMCSDDPETYDVVESDGIALDEDMIAFIDYACNYSPQVSDTALPESTASETTTTTTDTGTDATTTTDTTTTTDAISTTSTGS